MYGTDFNWSNPIEVLGNKLLFLSLGLHLVTKALFFCLVICQLRGEKYYAHSPCQITPQLTARSCPPVLHTMCLAFQSRALLLGEFLHFLIPHETKPQMVWVHSDWAYTLSSHIVLAGLRNSGTPNFYQSVTYSLHQILSVSQHEPLRFPRLWQHHHIFSSYWN